MSDVIQQKQKILIVDDSEMNRNLLMVILEDEYEIIQAKDGVQAIDYLQKHAEELSLILLDLVMPQMDGFEVLVYMNKEHWIENVPVVIISAEDAPAYIKRGYALGVTDFIGKPFDANMVRRRVTNAILISAKQKRMTSIVSNQIYEKEKSSKLMISILSHIVEFRNGESGLHVLHIQVITEMILRHLVQKENNPYYISQEQISLISTASALHDIGKITIPDEILNKPGRLTAEEFNVVKGHSMAGANMLEQLPFEQREEPLVKTAYEICRWHHERYDGGGYPDGLKGEEIPISAQAVSLADVYDALTSKRCYKAAYSHEKAIEMILAGQCGTFNPMLLECLLDISSALKKEMRVKSKGRYDNSNMSNIANRFHDFEMESSEKIVQQLECERQRFHFLAEGSEHVIFTCTVSPPILNLNEKGMQRSGITEPVLSPLESGALEKIVEAGSLERLIKKIRTATREMPNIVSAIQLTDGKKPERFLCECKAIWASDEKNKLTGVVGKLIDIDEDYGIVNAAKEAALAHSRSSEFSSFYNRFKGQGFGATGDEAWVLLQYLQITYDIVRYVNPLTKKLIHVERDGRNWETDYNCYEMWNCGEECANCISAKCLKSKQRMMKFETTENEVYQITSMYVELEGRPCSLEMIVKLDDGLLPEGYTREEILRSVRTHEQQSYIDCVTGIYNKRYYIEMLCKREKVSGVALADVKGFKRINESFGYQAGDDVLRKVAQVLRDGAGSYGEALRYTGDDFVLVFPEISQEKFHQILMDIQEKVEELVFPGLPGVKLDLTVTGVCEPGKVDDLLEQIRI